MKQVGSREYLKDRGYYLGYHPVVENPSKTWQHVCIFQYFKDKYTLLYGEGKFENKMCYVLRNEDYHIDIYDTTYGVGNNPDKFFNNGCVFELTTEEVMLALVHNL